MTVAFGPFEIDLQTCEVRKHGVRLHFPQQSFVVLQALLERPGELVTREELIARLWGGRIHVDYERGINAAVARLRQLLSDSADSPTYIETVPRRGYRFIGFAAQAPEAGIPLPPEPVEPTKIVAGRRHSWTCVTCFTVAAAFAVVLTSRAREGVSEPIRNTVPLTSYQGYERNGAVSPDGRQVVFEWTRSPADTRVYLKVAGADPVPLTAGAGPEFNPVWSPDASQIAFLRADIAARLSLYVTPGVGGVERKVADLPICAPIDVTAAVYSNLLTWTRDGKAILVTACEKPSRTGLLLISATDGGKRWLLAPPAEPHRGDMQPAFSPDGRTLAFARRDSAVTADVYIAPYFPDSQSIGKPERLTHLNGLIAGITWMHDGKSLVFSAGNSTVQRLFRCKATPGTQPIPLQWAGDSALQPSVSASGSLIYSRQTSDRNIWRQELLHDKGALPAPVQLIASTQLDIDPQYSPDASRIAFTSTRSGNYEIWTCGSDGERCFQVTTLSSGALTGFARWSPDGRFLVFHSARSGNYDLYVVDASGGTARQLTNHRSDDMEPSFSHDGRHVYFASLRSGMRQVWRTPVEGGPAVQITTDGGGALPVVSRDGHRLFYARLNTTGGHLMGDIWETPLTADGKSVRLLDNVYSWDQGWNRSRAGLWCALPGQSGAELRFHELGTGRDVPVRVAPSLASMKDRGFSVSSDGRFLVYTRNDNPGSDLMFLEGF